MSSFGETVILICCGGDGVKPLIMAPEMTPNHHARIKEIVADALEREPRERAKFLRAACAGDEALLQNVESLLAVESLPNALDDPSFGKTLDLASLISKSSWDNLGGTAMNNELIRCGQGHQYDAKKHSSCPYCGIQGPALGKTAGKVPDGPDERTKPKPGNAGGKTVGLKPKELGFDPVVGWLVCIEGPDMGSSYKLFMGKNSIGRSEQMKVPI